MRAIYLILSHGVVNFYVTGVSRALLLELERHAAHMNISLSVASQRYIDHGQKSDYGVAYPPLFDDFLRERLAEHFQYSQYLYDQAVEYLMNQGHSRKQARGAARGFLPENTETRFLLSGHIRAFRDIITKRDTDAADAEIQEFARQVKAILKKVAPNSMIGVD